MRPIDADAAVDRYYAEWEKMDICDGAQDRDWLKQCIDEAPIIDPEDLRPHGRWLVVEEKTHLNVVCSECDTNFYVHKKGQYHIERSNYCPNCGAKMDEEVLNA